MAGNKSGGKGFGLLYEMGCGKTLTAIAIMGALYENGKIQKVLVVCPSTILPVWKQELGNMAEFPYICGLLNGSTRHKRIRQHEELGRLADMDPENPLRVEVINYEEVFREGIYEMLLRWEPDMVILDEGHRIKSHTSKTAKACYDLGDQAKYRLLLTGTPMTNSITDVYGIMRFTDQNVFGSNFYAFRNRYCVMGGYQSKQVIATKNQEECTEKLCSRSLRVTKADALDLPEETTETRYVQLSKEERKIYEDLRRNSLAELEAGEVTATIVITKMLRLSQVASGFIKLDEEETVRQIGHSKLDVLREVLEELTGAGQKVVVFARFTAEIRAICKVCEEMRLKYVMIDGSVKKEVRGDIQDQFQNDPDTMVFVGQLTAAGEGITLHAASYTVFFSTSYSYKDFSQAKARIHRKGQTRPCTHIALVSEGTIDEQVYEALSRKEDLAGNIIDRWREIMM